MNNAETGIVVASDSTNTASDTTTTNTGKGKKTSAAKPKSAGSAKSTAMPEGAKLGLQLLDIDPHRAVIGQHDRPIAVTDQLYDERASMSDEEAEIDQLADSMFHTRDNVVVKGVIRDNEVWISQGRRRTRAMRKVYEMCAKKGITPPLFSVMVQNDKDIDGIAAASLAENFGRMDDPPVLLAKKFARLMDTRGWKVSRLAELTGKTAQSVKDTLSLLKLNENLQNAIDTGAIGPTVGYKLAKLSSDAQNTALASLQQKAQENGGKIRTIDAVVAVSKAKGEEEPSDEDISDAEFEEISEQQISGGGKTKPAAKKKAKKGDEKKGPNYVPPTFGQWRKLMKSVAEGTFNDGGLDEMVIKMIRVAAGDLSVRGVAGLSQAFGSVGVKFEK